ncbi:GNAT family N-acetyltransferase [Dyella sedimenti]|uniref:GNAT family N-acetyltransferase n=1 Tax=Dyella sedimenti TaxID=2919947 RepID=UPI001FAA3890|nr:GNAT family N-acetyltransferase [Dyella sedimenti]
MPDCPAIRVVPAGAVSRPELLRLDVRAAQRPYVGIIADLLADAEQCPGCEPMAILLDGAPIGFYRIETRPGSIAGRDFAEPTLGLRAFFIDHRWQRRGLGAGALAALLADLARRHPAARQLALTVNIRNTAGVALYRRAGFADAGALYHDGPAGPQHLMLRALP